MRLPNRFIFYLTTLWLLAGGLEFLLSSTSAWAIPLQRDVDAPKDWRKNRPDDWRDDAMKIISALDRLIPKLGSPEAQVRERATQEIIQIGPAALEFLDDIEGQTNEVLERLASIRSEIERVDAMRFTEASRITLEGEYRLNEALQAIAEQSGNLHVIYEIPARMGLERKTYHLQDIEYWTALHEVMEASGLTLLPSSIPSDRRWKITVRDSQNAVGGHDTDPFSAPRSSTGVFDFRVLKWLQVRDFERPSANKSEVTLQLQWESRVQPLSISLPYHSVLATDSNGDRLSPIRNDGELITRVLPGQSHMTLSIPFKLMDRDVRSVRSLEAELVAIIPGKQQTFRFKNLAAFEGRMEQKKSGATVIIESIERVRDRYVITLTLQLEESHGTLESWQNWPYENPMYLVSADGEVKREPIEKILLKQSSEGVTIEYYFDEDPGRLNAVYQTFAPITRKTVKLKLENIELP